MSISTPFRALAAVLAALLIASCDSDPEPRADLPKARNLVMICIDTVRWDSWWIPERFGGEDAFTPWGRQSQVFSRAISAAPWTVPSVGSILTGLYPSQHGGGLFGQEVANLAREVPSAVNPAAPTLAEMLSEAGLRTGAVSAHPWFSASYGFERGFDNLQLIGGADKVTSGGLGWLDRNENDERFFLYLHYMDVHDPHLDLDGSRATVENMAPERLEMLRATAPESACGDDPDSDMCVRYLTYADSNLRLRAAMAELFEGLRERGVFEDTLVIIYSDHGEEFHEHLEISRERDEDPRGIHGFGHGQSLYQELLHVPLLAWHPGLPPQDHDRPVSLVDVMPSVMDWLGLTLPEGYEFPGRSFAPDLAGGDVPPFQWRDEAGWDVGSDRPLFASGIAYGPEQMAVIDGTTKLIWHQIDNTREYYDLAEDPAERNPGLQVDDRVADRLERELDRYFAWFDSQDYLPPELSDEVVEKLKGVGYLQGVESGGGDDPPADQSSQDDPEPPESPRP